jgi:hypothetical protein
LALFHEMTQLDEYRKQRMQKWRDQGGYVHKQEDFKPKALLEWIPLPLFVAGDTNETGTGDNKSLHKNLIPHPIFTGTDASKTVIQVASSEHWTIFLTGTF